jgi:hypothetical protein
VISLGACIGPRGSCRTPRHASQVRWCSASIGANEEPGLNGQPSDLHRSWRQGRRNSFYPFPDTGRVRVWTSQQSRHHQGGRPEPVTHVIKKHGIGRGYAHLSHSREVRELQRQALPRSSDGEALQDEAPTSKCEGVSIAFELTGSRLRCSTSPLEMWVSTIRRNPADVGDETSWVLKAFTNSKLYFPAALWQERVVMGMALGNCRILC